jgi:hypothetical protein
MFHGNLQNKPSPTTMAGLDPAIQLRATHDAIEGIVLPSPYFVLVRGLSIGANGNALWEYANDPCANWSMKDDSPARRVAARASVLRMVDAQFHDQPCREAASR